MKKNIFSPIILVLALVISPNAMAGAEELINKAEQKALNATNGVLRSLTSGLTESLKNFDSIKYLDISVEVQDTLNPAISITNVNSLFENTNSTFFNQNTFTHNNDEQTINFGLGYRKLLNNGSLAFRCKHFL